MYKFYGKRGEFLNFVEIRGIGNMYHWLTGDGRPENVIGCVIGLSQVHLASTVIIY